MRICPTCEEPVILHALSSRETECVRLSVAGYSCKEIGTRLGVSRWTVKLHLHHVYQRRHLHSRHELVMFAVCEGLFPTGKD